MSNSIYKRYVVVDHGVTPMSLKMKAAFVAVALSIVVLALEVISSHFYGIHLNGAEAGPSLKSAADQFKAGENWKQTADKYTPASLFCSDSSCPSVHRAWDVGDKQISIDEVQGMLKAAGYPEATNAACKPNGGSQFILLECRTTAADGAVQIMVRESLPQAKPDGTTTFSLSFSATKD